MQNDILRATDSHGSAILVLLDLSAAFDTLDHDLLVKTLRNRIGVTGSALAWFESYLNDRHQYVTIGQAKSESKALQYGVPQGSVLGPILFCLYVQPLAHLIEEMELEFHSYADDSNFTSQ